MHAGLMERWMETFMCKSWMKNFKKATSFTIKPRMTLSFNKIMTSSTLAKRPNNGFKTMQIKLWTGLHNLQTLAPLNTFGIIQKESWQGMKFLLKEFWSFGKG